MEDNYVCTLDQASIKKAKDELNEVAEDRLAAVQALREWIQAQPHIRCPKTDTHFLLRFLRWSKFSQIRAREKIEAYLYMRVTLVKSYPDLDPTEKVLFSTSKEGLSREDYYNVSIRLNNERLEKYDLEEKKMENAGKLIKKYHPTILYRAISMMMEFIHRSESVQVNGVIFVADFAGLNASVMAKMLTPEMGNHQKIWLSSNPGRFKAIHYYRAGVFIDSILPFVKLFMPKKLTDRIRTHDNMETVYKHISKDVLPVEYLPDEYNGENVGTIKDVLENYLNAIAQTDVRDEMLYRSSKAFGIDEAKRPKTTDNMNQHFRKLTVD